MRARIFVEIFLLGCLAVGAGCRPNAAEMAALQDEVKRLKAANQDLELKYNQAIRNAMLPEDKANSPERGGSGADTARLEEEVKKLREANKDLIVKYNRAIQELLKLRVQANPPNEKSR